jgi:hypothetical protein
MYKGLQAEGAIVTDLNEHPVRLLFPALLQPTAILFMIDSRWSSSGVEAINATEP